MEEKYVDTEVLRHWETMLDIYFESMEGTIAELRALLEGTNSSPTVEQVRNAKMRVHAVRGASAIVGFYVVARLLEEIENTLSAACDAKSPLRPDVLRTMLSETLEAYKKSKDEAFRNLRGQHAQISDTCGRR